MYWAIDKLSQQETGLFSVYSGLSGVKMAKKYFDNGYFVTYVSTSWKKEVSKAFLGGKEGMIIEIDKWYKCNYFVKCCDVSWISKFPDECEILFARSSTSIFNDYGKSFSCVVVDESKGIQTVSLRKL